MCVQHLNDVQQLLFGNGELERGRRKVEAECCLDWRLAFFGSLQNNYRHLSASSHQSCNSTNSGFDLELDVVVINCGAHK